MSNAQFNYHNKIERWRQYESDHARYTADKPKYKGISGRDESYSWVYREKGKQIATRHTLDEIYIVKCEHEAGKI